MTSAQHTPGKPVGRRKGVIIDPSIQCSFYLARKQRYCAGPVQPGQQYCANHVYGETGTGEARVPCPANTAHSVPLGQLYVHLSKCPEAMQLAAMRAQPYFAENINAGADAKFGLPQLQHRLAAASAAAEAATSVVWTHAEGPPQGIDPNLASAAAAASVGLLPTRPEALAAAAVAAEAAAPFLGGTGAERQAAAVALGPEGFAALAQKINTAHAALTAAHPLHSRSLMCLDDAAALQQRALDFDRLLPYDAKHVLQNAAIIGNMSAAGLLQQAGSTVFVELGAGKAYLTAWLHLLHPQTKQLILLDKAASFKTKADRRLRHTHLTRVTLDLKDVALLPLLQQHLSPPEAAGSNGGCKGGGSGGCKGGHSGNSQSNGGCKDGSNGSNGDCGVGCTEQQHSCSKLLQSHQEQEHRQQQQLKQEQAQGLEQPSDQQQMPPPQQQQQQDGPIPWVVHGKHLCGSATDFALRGCLHALEQQQQQQACFSLQGLAIASCCHHRCGWMAYVGRQVLEDYDISRQEFELVAWLTAWALCGHEAAPGTAQEAGTCAAKGPGSEGTNSSRRSRAIRTSRNGVGGSSAAAVDSGQCAAGGAEQCSASCGSGQHTCSNQQRQQPPLPQQQQQGQGQSPWQWHPADSLTHKERIDLGVKCKQLLDAGRVAWMQQQLAPRMQQQQRQQGRRLQQQQWPDAVEGVAADAGSAVGGAPASYTAQRVAYIDTSVTGENTLLLLGTL